MKRQQNILLVLSLALGAQACAPLTFSDAGEVDFEAHRSVYVDVRSGVDDPVSSDYLASELARSSGFEMVTTDPNSAASVDLFVDLALTSSLEDDGNIRYDGHASFELRSGEAIVNHGHENNSGRSPNEAVEDVLDDVSLHFIAPYRW
jgi:hypothetical protein